MNRLCHKVIWLIASVFVINSLAARNIYLDNKPATHVADMIRYGDVETSLFTGRVDFSIPIYSSDDPDFQFDIVLNYNSEGFMPCKSSGYVGLNWFLQAGGFITREVRNYPDEFFRPWTENNSGIKFEGMYHFTTTHNIDKYDIFNLDNSVIHDCGNSTSFNIGNDCYIDVDYQPDIFHFNFCGYQGTFIINNEGKAQILSGDYVKVDLSKTIDVQQEHSVITKPTPVTTSEITLQTKDGYTYIFGGDLSSLEYSLALRTVAYNQPVQLMNQAPPAINAWHLSKVIAPNGRAMTFHYASSIPGATLPDEFLVFNQYYDHLATGSSIDSYIKYSYTKECVLDSIYVDGEQPLKILFHNSLAARQYTVTHLNLCKQNYQLDSLEIISSNRIIGKAVLSYEYRSRMITGTEGFFWRFLSGVRIQGRGIYSLAYNHVFQYPDLALYTNSEFSNAIDQFGYWNTSSIQGLLQEVTFPTGGKQRFTFEQHRYGTERGFRIVDINHDVELYSTNVGSHLIGGARIQQIETYEDDNLVEKRVYTYNKKDSATSSGIWYNNMFVKPTNLFISNPANYSLLDSHIGYSHVEECIKNGQNVEIAKNTYSFDTGMESYSTLADPAINITHLGSPSSIYNVLSGMLTYGSNIYKKGKLLLLEYYKDGTLFKSVQRRYNGVPYLSAGFIPIGSASLDCVDTIVIFSHFGGSPISRKLFIYPDVLIQEVTNEHNGGVIPFMINQTYLHDKKLRLVREMVTDSKGTAHFMNYTYPDDIVTDVNPADQSPLRLLVNAHRISTPVEQVTGFIKDEEEYITAGSINLYAKGTYEQHPVLPLNAPQSSDAPRSSNSFDPYYPYLYQTLSLAIATPVQNYQPMGLTGTSGNTVTYDSRYKLDTEYEFDENGRLLSVMPFGKMATTYTWNGIYPVTRTIGNQTYTYTYIPHVGVSMITDPRGISTYYSYDNYGRLIETYRIVNDRKQVVNKYLYHIKTE